MSENNEKNVNFYRFGDVSVDCENFHLRKAGENIALTPRAFDVLVFLLRNSGRVVEKRELFEKVWKESFVSDNALTKIIREIRRAIGDDAGQPIYIETVPKRGYRFIAPAKNGNETAQPGNLKDSAAAPVTNEKPPKIVLAKTARRKKLFLTVAAVLGLIVAAVPGFIVVSEYRAEILAETAPIDSVAVLPFETEAPDSDLEYFSAELSANLINRLSQQPDLRVLPQSTVAYYTNKPDEDDPHTVGRILRVRAVLKGKILRRGDMLSVQVELINADKKAQFWGRQFNCPVSDAALIQAEISRALVAYLDSRSKNAPALTSIATGDNTD
ncbi:MAG TPA: winged helix-turn-helix domain-containing protein [Pyrinomonadaceae bacterium]|nr:winged helix-turn-helix domain-containing protein [Pyrinomonadaceae bacterium]